MDLAVRAYSLVEELALMRSNGPFETVSVAVYGAYNPSNQKAETGRSPLV